MVEPTEGDVQCRRPARAAVGAGHRVVARHARRAARPGAGPARADAEGGRPGHVTQAVVLAVVAGRRVGLARPRAHRRRHRRQAQVVERRDRNVRERNVTQDWRHSEIVCRKHRTVLDVPSARIDGGRRRADGNKRRPCAVRCRCVASTIGERDRGARWDVRRPR